MEPHPKRIKPTTIDDTNGKQISPIERNTNLFNKMLDDYGETFKTILSPPIRERLLAKAQKGFKNCSKPFKESSELRRLLQKQDFAGPLQHFEVIFKKFKENKKSSAAKSDTPKKDNEMPVENNAFSSEIYNKDLFEKFLDIVKERRNSQGNYAENEKLMVRAWNLFNNCKSSYKKSPAFEDLLRKAVDLSTVDPSIQLKTVLDELKFNKKVVSQQPVETNVNEPGCSTSTAHMATSANKTEENDSDDDDLSGFDPAVRKKIKLLEKTLRAVNLRIKHLEEKEVDFSREDDENSAYMKLDRYYRRFEKVYAKICELKKQNSDAGRVIKRKVTFPGGEIEKAIEKHYNKTNMFPDFHDVLKITKEVRKDEKLPPKALHSIAQNVFEEFGKMLQRRRQMDVYESACAYLTNTDPAEEDPELKAKLEDNYVKYKDSEKKVLDMYAEKSMGIEAEEVGSNVEDGSEEEEKDETRECGIDESSNLSNLESTVLDDNDESSVGDKCVADKVDSAESKTDVQRESDLKREEKAESSPENSANACLSEDTIIVNKDSECVNTEGKEPDILASRKDVSVGEIASRKDVSVGEIASRKDVSVDEIQSGNVEDAEKVCGVTSPVKIKKPESNRLTTEKENENRGTVDVGKKEYCSLTPRKEKGEKEKSFSLSPRKDKGERKETCSLTQKTAKECEKIESSKGGSSISGSKKEISTIVGSKSCKESESSSLTRRKDETDKTTLDSSSTKSSNGSPTKAILVSEDCKSRSVDKDSCRKTESEKIVTSKSIGTNSSSIKSVSLENNNIDKNLNKSESKNRERSEMKRKTPCENITEDKPGNKRPKIPEYHSSLKGEKSNTSQSDVVEVIEVETLRCSTNKKHLKKPINLDQIKTDTTTHKNNGCTQKLRTVSDGDEKKRFNHSSVDNNCTTKALSTNNGSSATRGVNGSSIRNATTNVPSLNKHSSHSAGATNVENRSLASRTSNVAAANSRSSNHSWRENPSASYTRFSNSCNNTSSPIITAAYSLAKPSGNSSTAHSTQPYGQSYHQQKSVKTSWSEAVTKYRIPKPSSSTFTSKSPSTSKSYSSSSKSSSSSSSTSKSKDVIVIDEGEDDLCIISEVRSLNKKPVKLEASSSSSSCSASSRFPPPVSSKLLDGNTIKYISGEKTKEMLKNGNVKVFSRLKANPLSNESKPDSVITLD